jgi:uncharacterized protein (DUF305 family)
MKMKIYLIMASIGVACTSCSNSSEMRKSPMVQEASVSLLTGGTTGGTTGKTENTTGSMGGTSSQSGLMDIMNETMTDLEKIKMSGDPDKDFATMMIEHDKGAIKMADLEINSGKDQKLVTLAKKIKASEEKNSKDLKNVSMNLKSSAQNKDFMNKVTSNMKSSKSKMQTTKTSGDIDKDFATLMSMHHQQGIEMAKLEKQYGKDTKLKPMAERIMMEHEKDVKELKNWMQNNKK